MRILFWRREPEKKVRDPYGIRVGTQEVLNRIKQELYPIIREGLVERRKKTDPYNEMVVAESESTFTRVEELVEEIEKEMGELTRMRDFTVILRLGLTTPLRDRIEELKENLMKLKILAPSMTEWEKRVNDVISELTGLVDELEAYCRKEEKQESERLRGGMIY